MAGRPDETTNSFGDDLDDFEYDTALSRLEQTQNRILGSTSRPEETTNLFGDDFEYDTALSRPEQTQNRILGSTSRCVGLIEESHDIAIKTAEELQRQEEALNRTERNLDNISRDMTTANRHIKSIKSVWGAIGNYFSKPNQDVKDRNETVTTEIPERNLNIDARVKLDYDQQDRLSEYECRGRGTAAFERQHDNDLSEMSRGLSILKDDAMMLGQTIGRHDEIITRVQGKIEKVDDEVRVADKKIKKILR